MGKGHAGVTTASRWLCDHSTYASSLCLHCHIFKTEPTCTSQGCGGGVMGVTQGGTRPIAAAATHCPLVWTRGGVEPAHL